jgi:hypothetical protein
MIGFYVIKQCERGVQFRPGRVKEGRRGSSQMPIGPTMIRPLDDSATSASARSRPKLQVPSWMRALLLLGESSQRPTRTADASGSEYVR